MKLSALVLLIGTASAGKWLWESKAKHEAHEGKKLD